MTLRRIDLGCVAHSPNVSRSLKENHSEPPRRQGRAAGQAALHLARAGRQADQQAGRRRVHPRARHPDERHRSRGAALLAHSRAHEPRAAPAAGAGPPRRAAPGDDGQLAARRRPFAAGDHDRLRAGRDRGDRRGRAARARPVSGAGLPLRPARGLRPPVSLFGAAGPAGGQGRQQHPAELHRHRAGPADRDRAPRAGGRPARATTTARVPR